MQKFLEEDLKDIINRQILPRLSKNGDGCWRFTGWLDRVGYGRITINRPALGFKTNQYVHRLMYAFYKGNIPRKKEIHHECHTRNCCNPDHLELKTRRQNAADWRIKAAEGIEVERF